MVWNYGPYFSAGEYIFYIANINGTGVKEIYPEQSSTGGTQIMNNVSACGVAVCGCALWSMIARAGC